MITFVGGPIPGTQQLSQVLRAQCVFEKAGTGFWILLNENCSMNVITYAYIRHRAFSTKWSAPNGPSYMTPDSIVSKRLRPPLLEITRDYSHGLQLIFSTKFCSVFITQNVAPGPQKLPKGTQRGTHWTLFSVFWRHRWKCENDGFV